MTNRRNMTAVQKIWREYRKMPLSDIMTGPKRLRILDEHGRRSFFWRPSEVGFEIVNIKRFYKGFNLYCRYFRKQDQAP